jgi:branched-chain amino acid transport system substrate-binding protein
MPYTNEKKVILIASNSSLDAFTGDDYMFRLIPRTSEFVAPLARYLYSHGVKTVAFARINTAFTQEHFQDFKQDYEKLGGMIVADETFVSPGLDVRSELTKIKQKKPDAVFDIHNSGPSIGLLVAQAHQVGLETKWISTWATENGALMKQYPEEIEGMIYPFMYDESSSQNSKIFADKIRNMGKTADFYVACGYDIVNLVARAMKDININNTDEIKASLLSIKDYDGATGRFGFDSNGDVTRDIFIKTVKDGKFVKVGE